MYLDSTTTLFDENQYNCCKISVRSIVIIYHLYHSSICAMSCLDCLCSAFVGCFCFLYVAFIAVFGFAGIMMFGMGIDFKINGTNSSDGSEAWPKETWLIGGAFVLLDVLLVTLTIYCCRYGCCWNNNQENWPQVSYTKHYQL